MSRNKFLGLAVMALLVASVAIVLQRQAIARARAVNAALSEKLAGLSPPASAPASPITADTRAAADANELAALRGETIVLQQRLVDLSAQAQALAAAAALASSRQKPVQPSEARAAIRTADALDAGQATPEALIQTFLWAVTHGETNRISQLFAFDAGSNPEQAQQFLDKLTRELASASTKGGPGTVRIVSEVPADGSDRWITTQESREEGQWQEPERVLFRLTDSGWKLVLGTNGEPVTARNN